MKAGQVNFASAALSQLQQLLREASAAVATGIRTAAAGGTSRPVPAWLSGLLQPDSGWMLDSARLKWLQGQQQSAVRDLQALVTLLKAQQQQQQASSSEALIRAQALLGEWMACGQSAGSAAEVIWTLDEAAKLAEQQLVHASTTTYTESTAQLHCDVFYQLAAYADQHYRELDSQMATPEWQKQLKVLDSKQSQVQVRFVD
jgi:hypothetical protein